MDRGPVRSPLVAAFAIAVALSCGGRGDGGEDEGIVRVDGSSTVYPITEAVAEEFQQARSGTRVTIGISGTGGGFQKFCRGEIDIAAASRPVKPAESDACAAAAIGFVELPVAYDGVAVVVHPRNTWATSLTVAELKRLWEPAAQGRVMRWPDLRPGWPDRELRLFGPGPDSGTFDYFTDAVVGTEDASRGDFTSSEDDNVLVQGVSGDEGALGFFGYAYYEENQARLRLVAIDGGQGPVLPSPETIAAGRYTPLSRPIFLYARASALDRPEVREFIEFYLGAGTALVREVGYVPLTGREYELVRARLRARTAGSLYGGPGAHGLSLEQRLERRGPL